MTSAIASSPRLPAPLAAAPLGAGSMAAPLELCDPREIGSYAADLKRRALALTRGDSTRAADLVQDTFERALGHMHRLLPQSNVRGWLYTIMVRRYQDTLRRDRVRKNTPFVDDLAIAAAPVEEPRWCQVGTAEVRAALAQLKSEYREVFERFEFKRQSYQRIARDLGIALATVGSRLSRAREQLRDILIGLVPGGDE